jgi:hypothetical protein
MPLSIKFHLDEHVSGAIAAGLRRRGIDVTTTNGRRATRCRRPSPLPNGEPPGRGIAFQADIP